MDSILHILGTIYGYVVGVTGLITILWIAAGAVVLIIWLCKESIQGWLHGREESAKSEGHDQEKNHVYFEERITTPLRDLFCSESDGSSGSDATGYYLPDEGIIRIHHYTYGAQGTSDHEIDDWPASSEEEAENVFDTWVDFQEDLLREFDPDIIPDYCDYYFDLKANGMTPNPDDPEWDWGGSYREALEDLGNVDELIERFGRGVD